jgi:beta-lactamase class A
MRNRRHFVLGASAMSTAAWTGWELLEARPVRAAAGWTKSLADEFARIERDTGGRLGVAVLDTANGEQAGHRIDERFPMCSTFKTLAAAAVLKRVDDGKENVDRRIAYGKSDLVTYSPATEKHVGAGMTLAELCEAAITLSDNTAGNLLLANIGGPPGLTAFARSLGDQVTRLDRIETALNEATPGDPRDTTTPEAMAKDINALVLGDALSDLSKRQLTAWLVGSKTGDARLRAGVPVWRVGDKTGSGEHGTANDAGVIWPPGNAPLVVAVYLTNTSASADRRNAAIADVGRAIAGALKA